MMPEIQFLRIKGGWISPWAVLWVETSKQNELMFMIGLEGKEKPIYLNEADSALLRSFLEENSWEPEEDEEYESQEEEIGD
jgi:hypothetical protein